MPKEISFGDGSHISFDVKDNGSMTVVLQAKHMGKEITVTSSSVELTPEETVDIVNWIAQELTK